LIIKTVNEIEKMVLKAASGDLPVVDRPFDVWAKSIGVNVSEFLYVIKKSVSDGAIRRFGAVLSHQKSGFKHNAMVAWKVPNDEVDRVGEEMARFSEVTHCYLRGVTEDWPYNMYTMIHAKTEKDLFKLVEEIAKNTGVREFSVLETIKELKKTSPDYFWEDP
jgi:DNA-binding Lrp family transcriptional regulator